MRDADWSALLAVGKDTIFCVLSHLAVCSSGDNDVLNIPTDGDSTTFFASPPDLPVPLSTCTLSGLVRHDALRTVVARQYWTHALTLCRSHNRKLSEIPVRRRVVVQYTGTVHAGAAQMRHPVTRQECDSIRAARRIGTEPHVERCREACPSLVMLLALRLLAIHDGFGCSICCFCEIEKA